MRAQAAKKGLYETLKQLVKECFSRNQRKSKTLSVEKLRTQVLAPYRTCPHLIIEEEFRIHSFISMTKIISFLKFNLNKVLEM